MLTVQRSVGGTGCALCAHGGHRVCVQGVCARVGCGGCVHTRRSRVCGARADDHDVSRNMLVNPGRPSIRLPRVAIPLERGCKQLLPPHRTMVDAFNF